MTVRITIAFLLTLCATHTCLYFLLGVSQPLLDLHGFRQAQTALTIYWLAQGSSWFIYETPVGGYPWSIPFEFPLYQLIAMPLVAAGVPVEVAGRLVSIGFFFGWYWPLRMLFGSLKLSDVTLWVFCTLLLASPIYAFWARTVMIETCAVFFGLLWLALLVRYLHAPSPALFVGAILAGCMCGLVKVTSFPSFALVGGLYFVMQARSNYLAGDARKGLQTYAAVAAIGVVPILAAFAWTYVADQIKLQNQFGAHLTSSALNSWNLGTWDQRWSGSFWWDVVMSRSLPDMFGSVGTVLALAATGIGLASQRFQVATSLAIVGFLTAFLLFTNLHAVHNYYQSANAIFGLAAVAFGISTLLEKGRWMLGFGILILIVGSQFHHFALHFAPAIRADQAGNLQIRVAAIVRENTSSEHSVLVFGDDWSSAIPFYAERKSFVVPGWLGPELVQRILANPQQFLGDHPIGAIVACPKNFEKYGEAEAEIRKFVAKRKIISDLGECAVLQAAPS